MPQGVVFASPLNENFKLTNLFAECFTQILLQLKNIQSEIADGSVLLREGLKGVYDLLACVCNILKKVIGIYQEFA